MRIRYLSYAIKRKNPAYGDPRSRIGVSQTKSVRLGDSSNKFEFTLDDHCGTHVDCPAHFFDTAVRVADYKAADWYFRKPFIVNLKLRENSLIYPSDIGRIRRGSDLVLIQSGFYRFRGTNKYSMRNPGIASETAFWMRNSYPAVKAVGFDFISLSSYGNREEGRRAHRAFFDPEGRGEPIRVIEDMDLSGNLSALKSVWVIPVRIEGVDSAPCTVVGIFKQNHR